MNAAKQEIEKAGDSEAEAIQSAGSSQVETVNAAGDTQTKAVQSAGAEQVSAVGEAGTAQIKAVQSAAREAQETAVSDVEDAGAKQQSAVAGVGTQALEAIGQTEQAVINQVKSAGTAQAETVQQAGNTAVGSVNKAADAKKTELEAVASHPPQPNTVTGKWQVWDAETGAYADTDALYQGGYYTPSVSDDGELTWQGSQEGMPTLTGTNIKGPKGDPGLGVPEATPVDAGKVPMVKPDGSGYELGKVQTDAYTKAESDARFAPIAAAIRPTASGNPATLENTLEWPMQGLSVYGKSTQDGTPSPDSPVPIVSAGEGGSIAVTVSDGADQSQQLTVNTPNGLPGIPVDSGGNYTDSTGQQWVCDEVDFARGVYVQRCALEKIVGTPGFKETLDNPRRYLWASALANTYGSNKKSLSTFGKWLHWGVGDEIGFAINDRGVYFNYLKSNAENEVNDIFSNLIETNQCYILSQLATLIETPLSEEEIAAYKALHTYDGATVVSTVEDVAGLSARAIVDPAAYIDSKIQSALAPVNQAVLEAKTNV